MPKMRKLQKIKLFIIRNGMLIFLFSKNSQSTADDDDVTDGSEGGEESLHHQFEARSSVDDPQRSQGSDDPKHSEYFENVSLAVVPPNKCRDEPIYERDDNQQPVQSVPVIREIVPATHHEAARHGLHDHLEGEDEGEDVVGDVQQFPLGGPGWDGRSLHGQSDAVSSDENQNDEVKPILRGQHLANLPGSGVFFKNIQRIGLSLDEIISDFFQEGLFSDIRTVVVGLNTSTTPGHQLLHKTFLDFLLLNGGKVQLAGLGGITATIGWLPSGDS